ncbi:MAG: ABC transporter permease [Bifidobacteriaceae bacterium]|nr:ABC transporter permease [Bifidobacteriaceae bacterium]
MRSLRQLLPRTVLVCAGVVLATFVLLSVIPGDAATALLGSRADEGTVAAMRSQFGLDRPWWVRLWGFLTDLFHGGGVSFVSQQPVAELVAARIGPTLTIVGLAFAVAVSLSLSLALLSAARHNQLADQFVRLVTTAGVAIPSFLLGVILILVAAVWLRLTPVGGTADGLRSYLLPAFTAAFAIVPVVTRSLRVELLEAGRCDYVAAARAAGLSEPRITLEYLLPNAAIPAITLIGVNFAYLIGGTFIVEKVFAINGIGSLMFEAIGDRDIPVIQGLVVYVAVGVVLVNTLTEVVVHAIDPRRRVRGAAA